MMLESPFECYLDLFNSISLLRESIPTYHIVTPWKGFETSSLGQVIKMPPLVQTFLFFFLKTFLYHFVFFFSVFELLNNEPPRCACFATIPCPNILLYCTLAT